MHRTIVTDENGATSKHGVFAGGDVVTGSATVISGDWVQEKLQRGLSMSGSDEFGRCRLAVYGTLRRGGSNHSVIEGIAGAWTRGFVHGHLEEHYGFPFFVPDAGGDVIPVDVLTSSELPTAWERIDRFEGRWYRRCLIPVHDSDGAVLFTANIYCKLFTKV